MNMSEVNLFTHIFSLNHLNLVQNVQARASYNSEKSYLYLFESLRKFAR
ncbi:hypothetical protein LEP1GSC195_0912 [Leptospira wolbachii serovar Codice str. CDC]|uniref:Uncharacterized protein n=1 Tax=Leptospira wolbachii serovar Codice str. CDC TaxID=1218599 RepID=R9A6K0_9LEPT|nr:hypothetical protein LEP1GSC195_0912 [Leptospira wolbachii serovar Codice str. CDC]